MDHVATITRMLERPWALPRSMVEAIASRLSGPSAAMPVISAEAAAALAAARAPSRAGSVAVLPIMGVMRQHGAQDIFEMIFGGGGVSTERTIAELRSLLGDESVGAIVLNIDSPGGEVYGTPELAEEVYKARGIKPIVAVANSQTFSAAYWVASQADEIVVTPSGEVGSIGVWTLHADFSEMDKSMGVKFTLISAGRLKTAANDYEPLDEEARDLLQKGVDEYYDMFVRAVARGRGVTPAQVRGGFGEGWIVGAKEAVSMKMADRVGTLRDTVARLAGSRPGASARAEGGPPVPVAGAEGGISPEEDLDLRERERRLSRAGR